MERRLHYVSVKITGKFSVTNIKHSIFGPDHA
jgi:hypothetical protein